MCMFNAIDLPINTERPFNIHLTFEGEIQRSWFNVSNFACLINYLVKRDLSLNNTGWAFEITFE